MKLNLASHGNNLPDCINIDFYHPSADLKADVSCLPFEDESVDWIIAFHILEHFRAGDYEPHLANQVNKSTVLEVLKEWKRVLKPGGILELKVPDFEKIAWLWFYNQPWSRNCSANYPFAHFSDWICSNGQHQCVFDADTMERVLKEVGFVDIDFLDNKPDMTIDRANIEMHVQCFKDLT